MTDKSEARERTKTELSELEAATGIRLWKSPEGNGAVLVRQVEGAWRSVEDPAVTRTPRSAIDFLRGYRARMEEEDVRG